MLVNEDHPAISFARVLKVRNVCSRVGRFVNPDFLTGARSGYFKN